MLSIPYKTFLPVADPYCLIHDIAKSSAALIPPSGICYEVVVSLAAVMKYSFLLKSTTSIFFHMIVIIQPLNKKNVTDTVTHARMNCLLAEMNV